MRRTTRRWAIGLAGLAAVGLAAAQDPAAPDPAAQDPAAPDPGVGGPVPGPFRGYVVADLRSDPADPRNRTGKLHDFVVGNGLAPVAAVFARTVPAAPDAPVAELAAALNKVARAHRGNRAAAFVAFLTLDKSYPDDEARADKAAAVRGLADLLKLPAVPFVLAAGRNDPDDRAAAWGVGPDDDLVVVVYHDLRVVYRKAFAADRPPTADDIRAVVAAFEKEAKGG